LGKKLISVLVPALVAAALIFAGGCGVYNPGGGSGGGSASNPGQAQGLYLCTLTTGEVMAALILPTDQFFGVHGPGAGSPTSATGLLTGQGASVTNGYSGSLTDFLNGNAFNDSLTATDMPGESIGGSFTESVSTIGFGGTPLPTSLYNFNTAASQAAIASAWTGNFLDGTSATVTITPSGGASTSSGCLISGTLTADTKNNFYHVSLTFGPTPCASAFANKTATGAAVDYLLSNGTTHQLLVSAAVGNTPGTVFFAQK
jgi:hypothetical protein